MSIDLSDVDLKVIRGINNAVAARGADWRYPNGMFNGARVEGAWDDKGLYLANPDLDWAKADGGCYNLLPNGDAACIIGFIAVDQGLPVARSSNASADGRDWGVSHVIRQAMISAQYSQDGGYVWGVAWDGFYATLAKHGASPLQIAEWKELR